jgi:ribosomal protein S4
MKKQFLNRVQHIYLHKRLPENLVPWKILKKGTKQTQGINQTKKAVGLPLVLKKGARGIHQKRLALKFAPSLKIDVLERGSLVSTPCSLKVWGSNVNRLSCGLKKEKKGTTRKMSPRLSRKLLSPLGTDQRSAISFDPANHRLDARYQILTSHSKVITNYTVGGGSSLRQAQAGADQGSARRGSTKQPLEIESFASNKSKPLSSFKWRKGASLYSCFQLEGSLSKQQEKRSSPFLLQLLERKKLRILYGNLSNREINAVIKQAKINRGGLGDNIFRLLESRLDVVLRKIGFLPTISFARQWVYHGKVQVNSKVLTIANYNLQPGDVISISPSHCQFLKTQMDALLDRHMVKRAATSVIDHHNLFKTSISSSKMSTRWTPEGKGATKNHRSLAIPLSKPWFGWEKNRSLPFNPLSVSSPVIDHSLPIEDRLSRRFRGDPLLQPWSVRESLLRTPLNLASIMGFLMIGPDMIRPNDSPIDLPTSRCSSKMSNPSGSSLMINQVDQRLSVDQREKLRFFSLKLTHVEVSFRLFTAIYLYSPQRILLPATIDIEKIRKSQTA